MIITLSLGSRSERTNIYYITILENFSHMFYWNCYPWLYSYCLADQRMPCVSIRINEDEYSVSQWNLRFKISNILLVTDSMDPILANRCSFYLYSRILSKTNKVRFILLFFVNNQGGTAVVQLDWFNRLLNMVFIELFSVFHPTMNRAVEQ